MKKLLIILLLTLATVCGYAHNPKQMYKLINEAIANGKNAEGLYCLDNKKKKNVDEYYTIKEILEKGYFIIDGHSKYRLVDKVLFTDDENLYVKFAFDQMKGDNYRNVSYNQLKPGGTFYYFYRVPKVYDKNKKFKAKKMTDFIWSGRIVDGLIDGKGIGMFKNGDGWSVFEGEFTSGILLKDNIKIKTMYRVYYEWRSYGYSGTPYKDYQGPNKVIESHLPSEHWIYLKDAEIREFALKYDQSKDDPLFCKAQKGLSLTVDKNLLPTYKKDAAQVKSIYDATLAINKCTYKIKDSSPWTKKGWIFYDEGNRLEQEKQLLIEKRTSELEQFVKKYENANVDSLQMIPKANEILELYNVLDRTGSHIDYIPDSSFLSFLRKMHAREGDRTYLGEGWISGELYFKSKELQKDKDNYYEALRVVKEKSQSATASFREFYRRVKPQFVAYEQYQKDYFYNAYDYYLIAKRRKMAEKCENCKIDGDKTTIPSGYEGEEKGFFFGHPARSKEQGTIHLHNGELVGWRYIYKDGRTKLQVTTTLGGGTYNTEQEMMQAIIGACVDKYCK